MLHWLEDKIDSSHNRGNHYLAWSYEILIMIAVLILFVPSLIYNSIKLQFFTRPYDEMVEEVAKTIFYTESGAANDEEWEMMHGIPRPIWKTDAPWDTNDKELTEWQRDDYRWQAKAVLQVLGYRKNEK